MAQSKEQPVVNADALLYIEGGKLQAGRLLAEGERNLRIVDDKGDQRRLDRRKLVARVSSEDLRTVMDKASELAGNLVMEQVWALAAGENQTVSVLAAKCMPKASAPARDVALALANSSQRGFFLVRGNSWEPVTAQQQEAMLASMAARQRQQELEQAWERDLADGVLPPELSEYLDAYVADSADPQDKRHRFLRRYGNLQGKSMGDLAVEWGRISDLEKYHLRKLSFNLPPAIDDPGPVGVDFENLAVIGNEALAIDSKDTTEVDDAFGLADCEGGGQDVYIHIAAPALGMSEAARRNAEQSMSTIYLPGQKHMMLPDATVKSYSFLANTTKPCVSLKLHWDAGKREATDCGFSLGKVGIECNLDIERFNGETLEHPNSDVNQARTLEVLASVAERLMAETNFKGPTGQLVLLEDGIPNVIDRNRFVAADKMVAALMVSYNRFAASFLNSQKVPFLVRREGHIAISNGKGKNEYGWFSSPLRRLADLVNQEQLIAVLRGQTPPHTKQGLVAMVRPFNQRYGWVQSIQSKMETYWCLRWLAKQVNMLHPGRTVAEPGKVRLAGVPVTVRVRDCNLPPNTEVNVKLERLDNYALQAWGILA